MADTLGTLNPFRYRGYVFDEETGLYYLRSRYYNPVWGRFVNADSLLGKKGNVLSHNIFLYCKNNPIVFSDTSGCMQDDIGGGVARWRLPQNFDPYSILPPVSLNPSKDLNFPKDIDVTLLYYRLFVTDLSPDQAKAITDLLTKSSTIANAVYAGYWGFFAALVTAGASVSVTSSIAAGLTGGFLDFQLSQQSTYVSSGRYTTVIAVYDANVVEEGLRYILVGVFSDNQSALNGWNIVGVQQENLDLNQVYLDSIMLN
jgi:RHS repeat-associated protein